MTVDHRRPLMPRSERSCRCAVAVSRHPLRSGSCIHERFLAAAQRVLAGDDSIRAANELEGVVQDDYPGDERFDDLAEVLRALRARPAKKSVLRGGTGPRGPPQNHRRPRLRVRRPTRSLPRSARTCRWAVGSNLGRCLIGSPVECSSAGEIVAVLASPGVDAR